MNTTLTTTNKLDLTNIELTAVNSAILESVPDTLKGITAALMRAAQFSSGVSIAMCELLFKLKSNSAAIKATPYKSFGNYCDRVLRVDAAQASRYSTMYERLFYDVDTPFEKFEKEVFTTAQLVEISKIADRVIRKLFIEFDGLTSNCSSTNIKKAVNYVKVYDRNTVIAINWAEVKEILETGTTKAEAEKAEAEKTEAAKAEAEKTEAEKTEVEAIPDGAKTVTFDNFSDLEKWFKKNKTARVDKITLVYIEE